MDDGSSEIPPYDFAEAAATLGGVVAYDETGLLTGNVNAGTAARGSAVERGVFRSRQLAAHTRNSASKCPGLWNGFREMLRSGYANAM